MGIGISSSPNGITSQPIGSITIEPWLKVPAPSIPPPPPSPIAAFASGAAAIFLPVAAFFGTFFSFAAPAGDANELQNFNTGTKTITNQAPYTPPFYGGQGAISYTWEYEVLRRDNGNPFGGILPPTSSGTGPINLINRAGRWILITNGTIEQDLTNSSSLAVALRNMRPTTAGVNDTYGNLPNPNPATYTQSPSGYTGGAGNPDPKKVLPPNLSSAIGWGNSKKISPKISLPALGLGSSKTKSPTELLPPKASKAPPLLAPPKTPIATPPSVPPIQTPVDPLKEKKIIQPLLNPYNPNPNDVAAHLSVIGAILGTISANSTDIKNQTSPENQQANSKTGSCNALKEDGCTTPLANKIKDPINAKLDAAQIARDANAGTQTGLLGNVIATQSTHTGFFGSIGDKLNQAKDFASKVYEVSKLDKVYTFLTFLTTLHNASMLSNNLLQTLESTLSQGLATVGFKDPDGNPWDINTIINTSISDFLKARLGANVYADLDLKWKSANRIYQSGANMVYQVRSLWDSARSIAETTGANLGQLMNTLKKDGVVSENAYPTKSESPMMVNSVMAKLQNLDEAASHLNSITSQAYGVTETVAQMKTDKADFDKLLADSPLKKGIPNKAANDELVAKKLASPSPPIDVTNLVKPE